MLRLKNKNLALSILAIVLLNLAAHFLPFERSAFAPDDYAFLSHAKGMSVKDIVMEAPKYTNRPLLYLFGFLQEKAVALNPKIGVALVFLSTTILSVLIFILMLALFKDGFLALLGIFFYLLLPNKADLYHTLIYVTLNAVYIVYSLSFVLFVYFIKYKKRILLFFSILLYAVAIFWYEVGFFLPIVLFAYSFLYDRKKIKAGMYFLIPAVFYVIFRMTGAFGIVSAQTAIGIREVNFPNIFHNVFTMLPNHYFGRYMIRAIVYGIYKFPSIEIPWLLTLVLTDVALLLIFIKWLKNKDIPMVDLKLISIAGVMFFAFLTPNFLYTIESRHTALASIGFTIFCVALLGLFKIYWKRVLAAVLVLFLVVSQGTSWIQVVACRINNAVFEYLTEHRTDILHSERVVIDQRSFADNIPYTWGEKQGNMLDCYWGMQAFAPWGLGAMIPLSVGEDKIVYISKSRPKQISDKLELEIQVDGPYTETETIPKKGTLIIDYKKVYEAGFKDGNRVRIPSR